MDVKESMADIFKALYDTNADLLDTNKDLFKLAATFRHACKKQTAINKKHGAALIFVSLMVGALGKVVYEQEKEIMTLKNDVKELKGEDQED